MPWCAVIRDGVVENIVVADPAIDAPFLGTTFIVVRPQDRVIQGYAVVDDVIQFPKQSAIERGTPVESSGVVQF
jgi:hypothetical protein